MSEKLFDRVALIGIGLIGSSLARVLRRDCPETRIVACARSAETLDAVRRLDLADETTDDPAAASDGADLVVLAQKDAVIRQEDEGGVLAEPQAVDGLQQVPHPAIHHAHFAAVELADRLDLLRGVAARRPELGVDEPVRELTKALRERGVPAEQFRPAEVGASLRLTG